MDFSFTEEQVMLRDGVKRFLEKNCDFEARKALLRSGAPWSAQAWKALGEMGVLSLPFPEEAGGMGGSAVDLVPVAEVCGEHIAVEPWPFTQVLAGGLLVRAGAGGRVAQVAAGGLVAACAWDEGRGLAAPAQVAMPATADGDALVLNGGKRLVIAGAEAGLLVAAVRHAGAPGEKAGLALVAVDPAAPGVSITPFRTQCGRSAAHVRFDGVRVEAAGVLSRDAHDLLAAAFADTILVLAAETVGAMGALLRVTAAYANTRRQFGAPIGTFQAVAHRLADMKVAHAKAYATLLYVTALMESGLATARDVSVLKAQVSRWGRFVGEAAVQTHGGVGMTDELCVGHYLKRILAFEAMFGAPDYHFRVIGQAAA
ncbi:acyl-CoA dehydrogenase family protein [Camelimonas abortus]|uniref:Acyl-CoA dehydrogenase family protein n=1 Tax=Camelimonas abortus TaxID=1017184 RepID=A0ABV7LGR0_9HYPH